MKHLILAALLVIILTVVVLAGLNQIDLLPQQASLQAESIDYLFGLHIKVIAFLFSLIVGLMLYSIIFFRRKKGDDTDSIHVEGNTTLEVIWTVVPLGIVLFFSYLGAQILDDVRRVDPTAMEVNVIGQQWSWRFEYPDYGVTSSVLALPVNQQTLLRLSSVDVIHSFWVPEFRVKQDALPGGEAFVRELRISPSKIGDYTVRCAELCGLQHAYMTAPVIVMSQSDFDKWIAEKQSSIPEFPAERGRLWAEQYGCFACHSIDGTELVGPTWLGIYGEEVILDDGTTLISDEAYIYESIRQPGAKIVQGFENLMPADVGQSLTDEQIADIIEFMKTLSK